jgi:hypothetical protein
LILQPQQVQKENYELQKPMEFQFPLQQLLIKMESKVMTQMTFTMVEQFFPLVDTRGTA